MRHTVPIPAWHVVEGDVSPAGTRVVSVQRDAWRGQVRVGFSDGRSLEVPRGHVFVVTRRQDGAPRRAAG